MIKLIYNSITYDTEIIAGKGSLNLQHAMVGETLAVDSVVIPIMTSSPPSFTANAAGLVYNDETLVGKYYLSEMHQTGIDEYELTFLSAIKLLDQSKHKGGLYVNIAAGTIIAEIMGSIDYSVDEDIEAVLVDGYLPYDTKRVNLHKLLMAIGGALEYFSDGSIRITSLSDISVGTFGLDRVFEGGYLIDKVSATAVQVTEHNYIEEYVDVVLFDAASYSTETIIFKEPFHDLSITGGTIDTSGVNFCTFTGSGSVLLKGQRYQHVTRVITEGTTPTGSAEDVVKVVSENTLLTPNNAAEVAERLYNYLTVTQSIKAEVLFGTERPGDVVSIIHPYTRAAVTATIKSMDVEIGSELRATAEFLVGYTPPSLISGFSNYAILTGSGNWIVPAGTTKARAILIAAGNGGNGGSPGGSSYVVPYVSPYYHGGLGGSKGEGGLGGSILDISISVTPGGSISYDCGEGGSGGLPESIGGVGEATTFGIYSSAVGRKYPYGYAEPKSGLTLSAKGDFGLDGGVGNDDFGTPGAIKTITYKGTTYITGADGDDYYDSGVGETSYGGFGGGPAAGNTGGAATDGLPWFDLHDLFPEVEPGTMAPAGGKGGDGADAISPDDATGYGQGGQGGHGGGGAGASRDYFYGGLGAPGEGSSGSKGGPGAIIIYY